MWVVENRCDDSQTVSFIRFFPDREKSISKMLSVGSSMNMKNILPRFSNSISATDIG